MKKIFIILIILIIVVITAFTYFYYQYQTNNKNMINFNKIYESYLNQEVYGTDVMSIINKAIDNNEKNSVKKDENGQYINNESNSVIITIKFLGTDNKDYTYRMEAIAKQSSEEFIKHYGAISFKCTSLEYHENTKIVKALYFEQQV